MEIGGTFGASKVDFRSALIDNNNIDFQRIFKKANIAGLNHYIIEQDNAPDLILTITESINHFRELRF